MRKSINEPKRLSEEAEAFLTEHKDKINNETNIAVFSKNEKRLMAASYYEVSGRPAPLNCGGLCPSVIKILRNWLKWYDAEQVETVEQLTEAVDLTKLTKKEISEMYPTISTRLTKAQMIAEIYGSEEEE